MDCNERNGHIASSEGALTLTVIQIQSIAGISSGMGQIALSDESVPRFELGVIQIQSIEGVSTPF
jgi:hypothetical protein